MTVLSYLTVLCLLCDSGEFQTFMNSSFCSRELGRFTNPYLCVTSMLPFKRKSVLFSLFLKVSTFVLLVHFSVLDSERILCIVDTLATSVELSNVQYGLLQDIEYIWVTSMIHNQPVYVLKMQDIPPCGYLIFWEGVWLLEMCMLLGRPHPQSIPTSTSL